MARQPLLPAFKQPDSPELTPILELHRGHDGFVSFHRKDDDETWQDLFSIKAGDLEIAWPQITPLLERDSYFSINGFWQPGFGIARHSPSGLNLKRAYRSSDGLRWLTCCFADIDCYRLGISSGTAIGAIHDAQVGNQVPDVSMVFSSGRGVWAFWFLHDNKDQSQPLRAWPENTTLWCAVQRELTMRFADIGADAGSRDAARVTRIPGSVNSKALIGGVEQRTDYYTHSTKTVKRFVYRLDELAGVMDVRLRRSHPKIDAQSEMQRQKGLKGQAGRWRYSLQQFRQLWALRGTWRSGLRNNAVFIYASILKGTKPPLDDDVVWDGLEQLYDSMEQPPGDRFTRQQFYDAAKAGRGKLEYKTYADMLDITPAESTVLGRWPAASRFRVAVRPDGPELSQTEKANRRRELLKRHYGDGQPLPHLRELAAWLAEQGLPCAPKTVADDLAAVQITNHRGKKAKRRKRAQSRQRNLLR